MAFDGKRFATEYDDDGDLYSAAHNYVVGHVSMLYNLLPAKAEQTVEQSQLERLESILNNTPKILKDQNIDPRNEPVVYKAVGNVLSLHFHHLTFNVNLPKPLKIYKPDFGITDLGVAVEYKFAVSEQEVKNAVDGIFSDMHGYAGSSIWRRFYAVIYMTNVFYTREQLAAHASYSEARPNWKILLVHGTGSKRPRETKRGAEKENARAPRMSKGRASTPSLTAPSKGDLIRPKK